MPKGHSARETAPDSHVSSYNTIKRQPRSTMRYSTRMTLSFALTAVMTAVVLSIVLAIVWEGSFQEYTRQNMQRMVEYMADSLGQQYETDGNWSRDQLQYIDETSKRLPELGIRLEDADGTILYGDDEEELYVSCPVVLWDKFILDELRRASDSATGTVIGIIDNMLQFCEYCNENHTY